MKKYNNIRNLKIGALHKHPVFPKLKDSRAKRIYAQICRFRLEENHKMAVQVSEEAWNTFGEELFLYMLVIVQREAGYTGRAVKSAELLVSRDRDNQWYWKQLALCYMQRGYTKKAFYACREVYKLGNREIEFLLMYAERCAEYGHYETGLKILQSLLKDRDYWRQENLGFMSSVYYYTIFMGMHVKEKCSVSILQEYFEKIKQYSGCLQGLFKDTPYHLTDLAEYDAFGMEEYKEAERILEFLSCQCTDEEEKEQMKLLRERLLYKRQ